VGKIINIQVENPNRSKESFEQANKTDRVITATKLKIKE